MGTDLPDSADHTDAKLSYTIFPKNATGEQIYEYLVARPEEVEKAGDGESGKTGKPEET